MCVHDIKGVFKELNGFPYEMHVFREMQFVPHCYTVVSCQPILRHSVNKNSAVYLSGERVRFFKRYVIKVPRLKGERYNSKILEKNNNTQCFE